MTTQEDELPIIRIIDPLADESEVIEEIEPTPEGDAWRALRSGMEVVR